MISSRVLAILNEIAILFPVFLIIFSFRGFTQALIAKLMGDRTAQQDGFLSLNPLAHMDLFGLCTVLFVYFLIGALFPNPLPSTAFLVVLLLFGARMIIPVPTDERNFKNLKLGGVLTSISGGISNLLLALVIVIIIKALFLFVLPQYVLVSIMGVLTTTLEITILFGLLNLIPLPPFDAGKIWRYILPYSKQYIINWLEEYSLFIFLILFLVPGISDSFFAILSLMSLAIKKFLFGLLM